MSKVESMPRHESKTARIPLTLGNLMQMNSPVPFIPEESIFRFIESEIAAGRYATATEVIHAALLLLKKESEMKVNLNNLLQEGEDSGMMDETAVRNHLTKIRSQYK